MQEEMELFNPEDILGGYNANTQEVATSTTTHQKKVVGVSTLLKSI